MIDKRNQFLNINNLIIEVNAETSKKSASIKIAIPDELATKIMKEISIGGNIITGLQLSFIDNSLNES